jgi:hypothetical protein
VSPPNTDFSLSANYKITNVTVLGLGGGRARSQHSAASERQPLTRHIWQSWGLTLFVFPILDRLEQDSALRVAGM